MPEGIRKYYVGLLNLILLFLIAWQASPYATRSYDYRGVTGGAGGKGMMTLGKDVPVRSSAATDAKEASLDSSEWSLSDKLVAGRPAAVAGDATGSQARGSGAASDSHGRGQGVSGEAGLHREGAAADGGKGSAKAKERREHVCYTSSAPWKGYHLVPRNHLPPGVVVGGRGCARCVRGRDCGMRVWINAPATWVQIYPNASWWKKDMTLILKGPALSHGDVRCLDPPACSQLDLTYRLWDVGQYKAFLSVGCANLRFSPNYKQHLSQTHLHVALLPRVHPRSRNDLQGGWHSWWRFYPCAPSEPKRPAGWVAQLVRKGIQEINIVGDSHQRVLSFHLRYLLSGFADERMVRSHEDMNFTVTDERSSKVLRINFYWVDGIYRNREYGCSLRGQYTHNYHTFPNISTTANVTVIEGGYWAGKWCAEPLQALRARLPEFFIWALLAARSNRARVVFRTPPPVPNAGSHCLDYAIKRGFAGPATNLYLAAANRHARQLAASVTRGAEMAVFDSWAVEAPRYGDTCPGDHHYSCFLGGQKRTKPVVRGAVGDAVARTFLHFLLHSLRMEDSSTAEEQNNT
ncbi:unnamed protein product [Closterium sp. NIES-64]|nr:unnamed protein product [Closterium sp. NIES-64]